MCVPREQQPLLLQVSRQRLLADLQLLQQVRQQLAQRVVAHAARDHVGVLVGALHDLLPGLVDVAEPLGFLEDGDHIWFNIGYTYVQLLFV